MLMTNFNVNLSPVLFAYRVVADTAYMLCQHENGQASFVQCSIQCDNAAQNDIFTGDADVASERFSQAVQEHEGWLAFFTGITSPDSLPTLNHKAGWEDACTSAEHADESSERYDHTYAWRF